MKWTMMGHVENVQKRANLGDVNMDCIHRKELTEVERQ